MRARRKRRCLFNLFAFALLAVAIYLIAFSKEEDMTGQTVHAMNNAKTGAATAAHENCESSSGYMKLFFIYL